MDYNASAGAEANLQIGSEAVLEQIQIGAVSWPPDSQWSTLDSMRYVAENMPILAAFFPEKTATAKLAGIVQNRFAGAVPNLRDVSKAIAHYVSDAVKFLVFGLTVFGIYYAYKILKEMGVFSESRS